MPRSPSEGILAEVLHEATILTWDGAELECKNIMVGKLIVLEEDCTYSDGSRQDDLTAPATSTESYFLGEHATGMEAELLGMAGIQLESGDRLGGSHKPGQEPNI